MRVTLVGHVVRQAASVLLEDRLLDVVQFVDHFRHADKVVDVEIVVDHREHVGQFDNLFPGANPWVERDVEQQFTVLLVVQDPLTADVLVFHPQLTGKVAVIERDGAVDRQTNGMRCVSEVVTEVIVDALFKRGATCRVTGVGSSWIESEFYTVGIKRTTTWNDVIVIEHPTRLNRLGLRHLVRRRSPRRIERVLWKDSTHLSSPWGISIGL
ncbi:hypothetical protein D3C73_702430 [compost metagenome]